MNCEARGLMTVAQLVDWSEHLFFKDTCPLFKEAFGNGSQMKSEYDARASDMLLVLLLIWESCDG